MKLRVGDKVKFLNDTGSGKITKIINKDMVNVLNEDGFEVPVLKDELLKVQEDENLQEEVFNVPEEEPEEEFDIFSEEEPINAELDSAKDPDNEIYFAFVPAEQGNMQNSDLDLYLINDSDFNIFYVILLKKETSYAYFSSGILEDNTKIYLRNVERNNLSELKEFKFQIVFYQQGYFKPVHPIETDLKVKPQKFFKSNTFTSNDFFNEYAHIIELKKEEMFTEALGKLTEQDIREAIDEKESQDKRNAERKRPGKDNEIEEVDLHIEELVERPKDLSNGEMLEIQLDHFHRALQDAMNSTNLRKIVFIHGVGNGRLRYELRKALERSYPELDYQDASFKEYGYGATLVLLKK